MCPFLVIHLVHTLSTLKNADNFCVYPEMINFVQKMANCFNSVVHYNYNACIFVCEYVCMLLCKHVYMKVHTDTSACMY